MPSPAASWSGLMACARFSATPTSTNLAKELGQLAQTWGEWRSVTTEHHLAFTAWPIASSIDFATSAEELDHLAQLASQGAMGDLSDWIAAERRWKAHGVSSEEWELAASSHLPFGGSQDFHFPLLFGLTTVWSPSSAEDWERLRAIYLRTPAGRLRSRIAGTLLYTLEIRTLLSDSKRSKKGAMSAKLLLEIVSDAGREARYFRILDAVNLPKHLDETWLTLFERVGDVAEPEYLFTRRKWPLYPELVDALSQSPGRRGLITFLACLALQGYRLKIPKKILRTPSGAPDTLRWALLVLKLISTHDIDAKGVAKSLAAQTEKRPYRISRLAEALRAHGASSEFLESLLLEVHRKLAPASIEAQSELVEQLTAQMAVRQSPLQRPDKWKELGLPELISRET